MCLNKGQQNEMTVKTESGSCCTVAKVFNRKHGTNVTPRQNILFVYYPLREELLVILFSQH